MRPWCVLTIIVSMAEGGLDREVQDAAVHECVRIVARCLLADRWDRNLGP